MAYAHANCARGICDLLPWYVDHFLREESFCMLCVNLMLYVFASRQLLG